MVEVFSNPLVDLPVFFLKISYLEQLLCKEPVSVCYYKRELHNRRYLRNFRNFKNAQVCNLKDFNLLKRSFIAELFMANFRIFQSTFQL